MVLITPLISTIKRLYPHATIDVLVYKGTAKVLLDDDRINKTYEAHLSSETSFLKKNSGNYRIGGRQEVENKPEPEPSTLNKKKQGG